LTWNLEYYQQANKRLYRQGQKKAVVINHLIAKGTVDEDVLSRLQGKGKVQGNLLSYIKAKLSAK
jgi:SNF2 family DNA or RNA helicase